MIDNQLDEMYYYLSEELKKLNVSLLPIKFEQLNSFSILPDNTPVLIISSVRTFKEAQYFEKHLQKKLTLLLRQQKFTLMQLSSFEKTRILQSPMQKKNVYFLKYPMSLPDICDKMVKYHFARISEVNRWPGTRKAKPSSMIFN